MSKQKKDKLTYIYLIISFICVLFMIAYLSKNYLLLNDKYFNEIEDSFVVGDPKIDIKEFLSEDSDLIFLYWNQYYGRMRVVKVKENKVDTYLIKAKYSIMFEDTNLKNMPNRFVSLFHNMNNTYKIQWKHTFDIDNKEYAEILKLKNQFVADTSYGYKAAEDNKQYTSMHKYWNRIYVLAEGKMYSKKCSFDGNERMSLYFLKYFENHSSDYPDGWDKIMEFYCTRG